MNQLGEIVLAFESVVANPDSPLHFTPVAVRARIDGWTPKRQRTFIAALAVTGRAERAAAYVGMTARTATRLAARPDGGGFARACAEATTIAKRVRLRAAAARLEGSKGPESSKGFSLRGPAKTTKSGPFGPSGRHPGMPRPD